MTAIIWWLSALIYCIGYAFTFFRISGQMAWHMMAANRRRYGVLYEGQKAPNGEQWTGAIFFAFFLSIPWLISLPVAVALSRTGTGTGLFYIPRNEKQRIQAERIRELEKQAGIRYER